MSLSSFKLNNASLYLVSLSSINDLNHIISYSTVLVLLIKLKT